ncbi:MAG: hypothetical protein H7328_10315, partial [Bdellovibrio sp.]|nr:hypothetical protein [Bdellovibrio sp.]
SFLKDYRDQTWGWVNLPLLNKNNSWNIYTEQSLLITTAMVKSWTGFLNGGVKEFILK